ncbi:MAG: S46 family peptidase [Saprospiraceae bacterium]|nr:S46 family peptidase [Saprospiraceae bacterium]
MKKLFFALCALMTLQVATAQDPSPFDFGKMWTFENPPIEWFADEYDFAADEAWFEHVRKSSLRFATWCSASFVSPNGLIMTNHHCSRSVIEPLQKEGEHFDTQGFVAKSLEDERRADGLFVEQLLMIADITDEVKAYTEMAENDADRLNKVQQAFTEIQAKYGEMPEWAGLRLQTVTYYSGGKYSLYGYKRYDDIRLVFIPELDLGFYGGDPDNFTYPRYNLDATFWRAYDENGQPANTSAHYFKFNPDGIHDGTPVFVIGNPGSTERYRTVSQLEYDRDYRYPVQVQFMKNRLALMEKQYEANPSDQLMNTMFSFSNSIKAVDGIVGGLKDGELFERKVKMEQTIRAKASTQEYWDKLTDAYNMLGPNLPELQLLSNNPQFTGNTIALLHAVHQYEQVAEEDLDSDQLAQLKDAIISYASQLSTPEEMELLAVVLSELKQFADPGDAYIDEILEGRSPEVAAREILEETVFTDEKKLNKLFDKPKKVIKHKDEIFEMADELMPRYYGAVTLFQSSSAERRALEEKVANEVFNVLGDNLPPDATFTLRISDGRVKGYPYNGTVAPYKTTYFGMYDRHYSNNKEFPWSLPEKWANPPMELLKSPINFVSTNDIIGGNSGSAVINQDGEAVGLIFDGNIESLPGNFIYDTEVNRSVSVHAGGITAALRYIYKADRVLAELLGE